MIIKLVIDANILFAALIKDSTTSGMLITTDFQLFAPEFMFEEFKKYEDVILKKSHRTQKEFQSFLSLLKRKIKLVPHANITPHLEQASTISPDPKDITYIALALFLEASIWSNDKRLKENQDQIKVFSTADILELSKIKK